jgi:NTE family protein
VSTSAHGALHELVSGIDRPRVGLVLGGGGVLGAAWLMGAISALEHETGWHTCDANLLMGTSAGAVVAALTAGSDRPLRIIEAGGESEFLDVMAAAAYKVERPARWMRWGSWRMVVETWRGGGDAALSRIWAGMLPHGLITTRHLEATIDRRVERWPARPRLWIVATDYESGARHVFRGPGSAGIRVGLAVAASCAIPGFYRPVEIGSRLYVDGGVASSTNIDLLRGSGLDLIICMLPLSPLRAVARRTPSMRFRALLQRRLERQVKEVEEAGTQVVLLEPEGAAADLIGLNFMNRSRSRDVARAAARTVHERLREPGMRRVLETHGVMARRPGRGRRVERLTSGERTSSEGDPLS